MNGRERHPGRPNKEWKRPGRGEYEVGSAPRAPEVRSHAGMSIEQTRVKAVKIHDVPSAYAVVREGRSV